MYTARSACLHVMVCLLVQQLSVAPFSPCAASLIKVRVPLGFKVIHSALTHKKRQETHRHGLAGFFPAVRVVHLPSVSTSAAACVSLALSHALSGATVLRASGCSSWSCVAAPLLAHITPAPVHLQTPCVSVK